MKTFKQFINEADDKIYAKKLGDVPAWDPTLAEGDYKIGKITFSAEHGLGSVPYNQSINYHGFVAMIRPSVFQRLVLDDAGHQNETAKKLVDLVKDGYALGIPFITVSTRTIEDGGIPKITGHEGRGRMKAIRQINGDDPIPVHIILDGGLRTRNLTPELIAAFKGHIQAEQSAKIINSPFDKVYVNGKTA